ncbi:hypothetical protein HPB48_006914 [Haemaphysalis longicornis]|uniref:Uncharacterized protein n=1 Tax=Haemaphysalis longicornis TaxID=44386 RepID=A0A9J6FG80_HAELO|nr:hypothetical protein HPB48_006914 [Haemaphysalis longicornis]
MKWLSCVEFHGIAEELQGFYSIENFKEEGISWMASPIVESYFKFIANPNHMKTAEEKLVVSITRFPRKYPISNRQHLCLLHQLVVQPAMWFAYAASWNTAKHRMLESTARSIRRSTLLIVTRAPTTARTVTLEVTANTLKFDIHFDVQAHTFALFAEG